MIEALIDPWPPFTFCRPQAIVDQDAGVSIPISSPFSRSTRLPFTSTASPPAPLAIRKAPSASVESIEPRPPRPCEVGRPKGRRRKNRRQSHKFFLAPAALCTPHPLDGCTPGCTDDSIFRVNLAGTRKSLRFPHFFNNHESY